MTPWQNLWSFTTNRFALSFDIAPDDDLDLSWADNETLENLRTGIWSAFQSRMTLFCDGEVIATDHLGGSIYANPRDFVREHFGLAKLSRDDGRTYGAYFPDMVRTVIREGRDAIKRRQSIKLRT